VFGDRSIDNNAPELLSASRIKGEQGGDVFSVELQFKKNIGGIYLKPTYHCNTTVTGMVIVFVLFEAYVPLQHYSNRNGDRL
jgi:hypothetical protein